MKQKSLSADQWKETVLFLKKRKVNDILFTGGEILLLPEIKELLAFARRTVPDGSLSIFTNGSLMTEELFFLCKMLKIHINISLQGLRTYGTMTGTQLRYDPILELLAFGHENHWQINVSITVTRENLFEITDIYSAAVLSGAAVIQMGCVMFSGRCKDHPELTLRREEWEDVKKRIRHIDQKMIRKCQFADEMICRCRTHSPEILQKFAEKETPRCSAGKSFGVIGPDGNYRKCLHYPGI